MHPSLYPVEKTLFAGADTSPDAPLVVDVAGGLGHDIDEFKKYYPNHPGVSIICLSRKITRLHVLTLFYTEINPTGSSCRHPRC